NLKVVGSNPTPATKNTKQYQRLQTKALISRTGLSAFLAQIWHTQNQAMPTNHHHRPVVRRPDRQCRFLAYMPAFCDIVFRTIIEQ
ncbi:MAG: hypothetical protein ACK4NE_09790, partial [Albidovulum sp.]